MSTDPIKDRIAKADAAIEASMERIRAIAAPARAALSQPEPVAPTDEEIEEWADAATEVPLEEMDPEIHGWRRCFTAKEFSATIRAALARWGTPANNTREENLEVSND
jgi:hypothetical protein